MRRTRLFVLWFFCGPHACSTGAVTAVITEYDGSFNAYISDFVDPLGGVFNALLGFVVGGAALIEFLTNQCNDTASSAFT